MSEPMKIHPEYQHSIELEKKIESLYGTIAPDPAFERQLSLQMAQRARQLSASRPGLLERLKVSFQRRPAFAFGAAALVVLILVVAFAGPDQVLAGVQRLLGFVPGSGFVEPGETRLLAAPLEVKQGDVTLRIEKVIAGPKQTEISLTASGLPREKFGPQDGEQDPQSLAYLLLPDGQQLRSSMSLSGLGDILQASYIFDPLPAGVTGFTLVLPRLPGVPVGFAPENWSVPIQLSTVQVAPTGLPSDFPVATAYAPLNGLAQGKGVSVQVAQVGQAAQETGLQLQYRWDNPEWVQLNNVELALSDRNGRSYAQLYEPLQLSGAPESLRTYRFQPFEPGAGQATLTIQRLYFTIKSPAHFTLNFGQEIRPGQPVDFSASPDSMLEIAGVPVQVLSATLNPGIDAAGQPQPAHYHLDVLLQSTPQNGLSLENVSMSTDPELMVSSSAEVLPGNRQKVTIDLPQLPGAPLTVYFSHGEVSLEGPWVIQWDLPSK